jgi:hypothetical protein
MIPEPQIPIVFMSNLPTEYVARLTTETAVERTASLYFSAMVMELTVTVRLGAPPSPLSSAT